PPPVNADGLLFISKDAVSAAIHANRRCAAEEGAQDQPESSAGWRAGDVAPTPDSNVSMDEEEGVFYDDEDVPPPGATPSRSLLQTLSAPPAAPAKKAPAKNEKAKTATRHLQRTLTWTKTTSAAPGTPEAPVEQPKAKRKTGGKSGSKKK
ncbi:unnamed protein product, partial [Peniophora sp. CBMAI 1063]